MELNVEPKYIFFFFAFSLSRYMLSILHYRDFLDTRTVASFLKFSAQSLFPYFTRLIKKKAQLCHCIRLCETITFLLKECCHLQLHKHSSYMSKENSAHWN